jgi:hypothetical protein
MYNRRYQRQQSILLLLLRAGSAIALSDVNSVAQDFKQNKKTKMQIGNIYV